VCLTKKSAVQAVEHLLLWREGRSTAEYEYIGTDIGDGSIASTSLAGGARCDSLPTRWPVGGC